MDPHKAPRGFTLIELLVSVSIIAMLMAMLVPGLMGARERARAAVCGSNIRQVFLANAGYAVENRDHLCPGASDFLENLHRWHGSRTDVGRPFDPRRGPLTPYLGADGTVKNCPSFHVDIALSDPRRFERGCGGYGYNSVFVGTILRDVGYGFYAVEEDRTGVQTALIHRPGETVMFTDTAFLNELLIDYSFAEARFHPTTGGRPDPSIHFRHRGLASVAWCDGHTDSRRRTFTASSGFYPGDPGRENLGWFGATDDNGLFDLK